MYNLKKLIKSNIANIIFYISIFSCGRLIEQNMKKSHAKNKSIKALDELIKVFDKKNKPLQPKFFNLPKIKQQNINPNDTSNNISSSDFFCIYKILNRIVDSNIELRDYDNLYYLYSFLNSFLKPKISKLNLKNITNYFDNVINYKSFIKELYKNKNFKKININHKQILSNLKSNLLNKNQHYINTDLSDYKPVLEQVQSRACGYYQFINSILSIYRDLDSSFDYISVFNDYKKFSHSYILIAKFFNKQKIKYIELFEESKEDYRTENNMWGKKLQKKINQIYNKYNNDNDSTKQNFGLEVLPKITSEYNSLSYFDFYSDNDADYLKNLIVKIIKIYKYKQKGRKTRKKNLHRDNKQLNLFKNIRDRFSVLSLLYPYAQIPSEFEKKYNILILESQVNYNFNIEDFNLKFIEHLTNNLEKGIKNLKKYKSHIFMMAIKYESRPVGILNHWIAIKCDVENKNNLKISFIDSSNIVNSKTKYHQIKFFINLIKRSLSNEKLDIKNELMFLFIENGFWSNYNNFYSYKSPIQICESFFSNSLYQNIKKKIINYGFYNTDKNRYELPLINLSNTKNKRYMVEINSYIKNHEQKIIDIMNHHLSLKSNNKKLLKKLREEGILILYVVEQFNSQLFYFFLSKEIENIKNTSSFNNQIVIFNDYMYYKDRFI